MNDKNKSEHDKNKAKMWMIVFAVLAGLEVLAFFIWVAGGYMKKKVSASFGCGCSSSASDDVNKMGFRFY